VSPDETPPRGRYEEVRQRLLERGYLTGHIERFMLQDTLREGRAWRGVVRSASRAAIIGGPVFGALLAVAAAGSQRPILGPADLPLLWLYFCLPAAISLFVLELVAAAAATALAGFRGARAGFAIGAGLLVGLPVMVYVALIWWSGRSGDRVWEDVVFLAFAMATGLLVAWLGGLVSLAGIIGRTGEVPHRKRRLAGSVALVLIPLSLALLITRGLFDDWEGAPAPDFDVDSDGGRLLFVGVDGMDADFLQALDSRDAVPGLLEAMERGSTFPLHRDPDYQPPEAWTTLVTGVPPAEHGVHGVGAEQLPGVRAPLPHDAGPISLLGALGLLLPSRTVPVSGAWREVRTLWEIVALEEASMAVGWWASWPAPDGEQTTGEGITSFIVTDRVLPKLLSGAAEDRDTAPASLYSRLRGEFEIDRSQIRDRFGLLFERHPEGQVHRLLWESYLIDAYSWRIAARLMADTGIRAGFVYLPGLDILRQRLGSVSAAEDPAGLLRSQAALEDYAGFLDEILALALDLDEGLQVVLVADPGRRGGLDAEGFVTVLGSHATEACVGSPLSDLEVAPLVLRLLGYPLSEEMPGRPPRECLTEFPSDPSTVPGYGRRSPRLDSPASDYDPEMVERLRSLGYLN
jgi:hypothetical protein